MSSKNRVAAIFGEPHDESCSDTASVDLAANLASGWGRLIVSHFMPEHWSVRSCMSQALIRDCHRKSNSLQGRLPTKRGSTHPGQSSRSQTDP